MGELPVTNAIPQLGVFCLHDSIFLIFYKYAGNFTCSRCDSLICHFVLLGQRMELLDPKWCSLSGELRPLRKRSLQKQQIPASSHKAQEGGPPSDQGWGIPRASFRSLHNSGSGVSASL